MIRSSRQHRKAMLDLARWHQLRRRMQQMVINFFEADKTIDFKCIDDQIESISDQLNQYNHNTFGGRSMPNLEEIGKLGENLIAARLVLGWSQKKLADKAGLSYSQINRYESKAYSQASLKRLTLVARVLSDAHQSSRAGEGEGESREERGDRRAKGAKGAKEEKEGKKEKKGKNGKKEREKKRYIGDCLE